MGFRHGVVHGHVVFILDNLEAYGVVGVGNFGFQWGQGNPAAGYDSLARGLDGVSAHRTHVELAFLHVRRSVSVADVDSRKQFDYRDVQRLCQAFNQPDIGKTAPGFPLADGLAAYADLVSQFFLSHLPAFTQSPDQCACYVVVHGFLLQAKPSRRACRWQPTCRGVKRYQKSVDKKTWQDYSVIVPRKLGKGDCYDKRRDSGEEPERE